MKMPTKSKNLVLKIVHHRPIQPVGHLYSGVSFSLTKTLWHCIDDLVTSLLHKTFRKMSTGDTHASVASCLATASDNSTSVMPSFCDICTTQFQQLSLYESNLALPNQ